MYPVTARMLGSKACSIGTCFMLSLITKSGTHLPFRSIHTSKVTF